MPTDVALSEPLVRRSGLREAFGALGESRVHGRGHRDAGASSGPRTHRYCGRCATPTERLPDERCMRCPACGSARVPAHRPGGHRPRSARRRGAPRARGALSAAVLQHARRLRRDRRDARADRLARDPRGGRHRGARARVTSGASPGRSRTRSWSASPRAGPSGDIRCDPREIVEAAWFRSRRAAADPPPLSIARRLIDAWLEKGQAPAEIVRRMRAALASSLSTTLTLAPGRRPGHDPGFLATRRFHFDVSAGHRGSGLRRERRMAGGRALEGARHRGRRGPRGGGGQGADRRDARDFGGDPSWKDFTWDVIGTVAGSRHRLGHGPARSGGVSAQRPARGARAPSVNSGRAAAGRPRAGRRARTASRPRPG